jgi:nitroreductase
MAVLSTMRAMRHLAPEAVPHDLLRSVIEAATWAPSGGNWQVARYVLVTDRATMQRIAVLWGRVIEEWWLLLDAAGISPTGESAAKTRASIEYQRDHFADTPAVIVVCGDLTNADRKRGSAAAFRHLMRRVGLRRAVRMARGMQRMAARTEGGSVYPAVENLLIAARAHGLAACLTTWHLLAEDELKALLGIPRDVKTWAIVPVGWPLRRFGPVRRRPVDEVIHLEAW